MGEIDHVNISSFFYYYAIIDSLLRNNVNIS